MKSTLLTLKDLYECFMSTGQTLRYEAKNNSEIIPVQMQGTMGFSEGQDKDKEGLLPVHLQSCHTEKNLNGSYISDDAMESALPSFSNRPILGYIHDVDGQPEFYSHNAHIGDSDEFIYDETPVGVIPESCAAKLEFDEEKQRKYVVVDGYIYEEYSKAAEILRREGECPVSVELDVRKLSYDATQKLLVIEDFFFSGVTILGKTEDGKAIAPGMEGANIQIAKFSEQDEPNKTLPSGSKDESFREGGRTPMKFDELLKLYGKTAEDISFSYDGMDDEALETAFRDAFGEAEDGQKDPPEEEPVKVSYDLSHDDIRSLLYTLLYARDPKAKNYVIIDVFDDYFVYEDWYVGQPIYGQKYTKENDIVTLSGDPYVVHVEYLTDSEYTDLQSMRSNYPVVVEELENYRKADEEAKKDALLASEDYSSISDTVEFKAINESHADYSLDDLKGKLDGILLDYAKAGKLSYSAAPDAGKQPQRKPLANPAHTKKKGPYGTLSFN